MDFEFRDLGVEFEDYFSGFGCAHTGYRHAFTGIGSSEIGAAEDALEQACSALNVPDDDVVRMEEALNGMCRMPDDLDMGEWHYVGLLLDKMTPNQEETRFLVETYGEVKPEHRW